MKNFIISAITLICISGSMNAQDKLEQAGFYDSEIKTIETKSAGKSLIFFPMNCFQIWIFGIHSMTIHKNL